MFLKFKPTKFELIIIKKGSGVGQLAVYYYIDNGNNIYQQSKTPVWVKNNNHGDHWQFAQIKYEGGNQSVANFIIEGYAGSSSSGNFNMLS